MSLLGGADWAIIVAYFLLVFGVAIWATLRERSKRGTSTDYFLAGRDAGWFLIGGSLFASNIGSEHLVGLAGTGAASGVAVGQFEILASLILLLLGWVFVPFYLSSGVFTMPEFLERRYSEGARWYLAVISIVGYVLTKISVTIAAGGIVFEAIMGINFWTGALIVVVITGIYTIFGGLRVVLYTDLLQMFVLIGGAVAVTFLGLNALGGWGAMTDTVGPAFLTLWKPMADPDFPWTGILFGAPILGVWYWCTDQFIVQRVLAAKDQDQARRGTLFGGYLKLLPLFIFVIPGVIAYALSQRGQLQLDAPDQALPTLIGVLLPAGIRGLVVAGLLAALMSSLSSVFNSTSTLVTWDVYKKLRPEASERQLVLVGQVTTAVLVLFGLAWIPLMKLISGQLPPGDTVAEGERSGRDGGSPERVRPGHGPAGGRAQQIEPGRGGNAVQVRRHQLPALRRLPVRDLHGRVGAGEPVHDTAPRRETGRADLRYGVAHPGGGGCAPAQVAAHRCAAERAARGVRRPRLVVLLLIRE
jgi:SSS family solute:Na+ symporter